MQFYRNQFTVKFDVLDVSYWRDLPINGTPKMRNNFWFTIKVIIFQYCGSNDNQLIFYALKGDNLPFMTGNSWKNINFKEINHEKKHKTDTKNEAKKIKSEKGAILLSQKRIVG